MELKRDVVGEALEGDTSCASNSYQMPIVRLGEWMGHIDQWEALYYSETKVFSDNMTWRESIWNQLDSLYIGPANRGLRIGRHA